MLHAPWYVNNNIIHDDAKIPFVRDFIAKFSLKYLNRLEFLKNHFKIVVFNNND